MAAKMTKAMLVKTLAEKTNLTKKQEVAKSNYNILYFLLSF